MISTPNTTAPAIPPISANAPQYLNHHLELQQEDQQQLRLRHGNGSYCYTVINDF